MSGSLDLKCLATENVLHGGTSVAGGGSGNIAFAMASVLTAVEESMRAGLMMIWADGAGGIIRVGGPGAARMAAAAVYRRDSMHQSA